MSRIGNIEDVYGLSIDVDSSGALQGISNLDKVMSKSAREVLKRTRTIEKSQKGFFNKVRSGWSDYQDEIASVNNAIKALEVETTKLVAANADLEDSYKEKSGEALKSAQAQSKFVKYAAKLKKQVNLRLKQRWTRPLKMRLRTSKKHFKK
jgi:hypothetical protein